MKQIPEGMWDEELPLLMLACTRKHQVHSITAEFEREVQLLIELMFGGAPYP